jgi:hypothetical protein
MDCPNCGMAIPINARRCFNCGVLFHDDEEEVIT